MRESAYDTFTATLGASRRDMLAAIEGGKDMAAAQALANAPPPAKGTPGSGGPWAATVAQFLGPLSCGRTLAALSALDLARRDARPERHDEPLRCRRADGSARRLGECAKGRAGHAHHTRRALPQRERARAAHADPRPRHRARRAGPVLAAGAIRFNPVLPTRLVTALRAIPAGYLEQVTFRLAGNPLGLQPNETVLAKANAAAPALLRGRINGGELHVLTFGDAAAAPSPKRARRPPCRSRRPGCAPTSPAPKRRCPRW